MLPPAFFTPNEHNVRGGVEFGFMTCSLLREEALNYAIAGVPAILLEMKMGMIDRGADFSWFSQYPHEREIVFPPLTGIEVH